MKKYFLIAALAGVAVWTSCKKDKKDEPDEPDVPKVLVTKITLNKTTASIYKGATEQLSVVEVLPANATDKSVNWSSSNTGAATVDATGLVIMLATAADGATATITATANDGGGVSAYCTVQAISLVSGDGTAANPFKVFDAATLRKVASGEGGWTPAAHYLQVADIDLNGMLWTPRDFSGVYDGGGFKIINLFRGGATIENSAGLFSRTSLSTCVVKNVTLDKPSIHGKDYVGGITARNNGGTIENCHIINGGVRGDNYVGGIAGNNDIGTIKNCSNISTNIIGEGNRIGGIAGGNIATIENCSVTSCSVTGGTGSQYVGGITGGNGIALSSASTIRNCYATVPVTGYMLVGGISGNLIGTGTIEQCYATGNVSGENYIGGVVGSANSTVERCFATGNVSGINYVGGIVGYVFATVKNCYATGNISATNFLVGGVAGGIDEGSVQNCYATGTIRLPSNYQCAGGIVGGGNGSSSGTVSYCVALSKEVWFDCTDTYLNYATIGRILGGDATGTLLIVTTNNYARSNMGLLNSHIAVHDIIAI